MMQGRTTAVSVVAVVSVITFGGCAVLGSGRPTFESERVREATIVNDITRSLPAELIISVEEDESVLSCGGGNLITGGGDGSQIAAIRHVVVSPEFDASAWMDAIADEYEKKPGWEVDRSRENTTFPGLLSDTFWAPEGNSIGITREAGKLTEVGFNAREDAVGEPAQSFTIDASAECADKPANWDGFGDFLTETPLPTPLPSLPAD